MPYTVKCKGYEVECDSPEEVRAIFEWTDARLAILRWVLDPLNRARAVHRAREKFGVSPNPDGVFNSAGFAQAVQELSSIDATLDGGDVALVLNLDPTLKRDHRFGNHWVPVPPKNPDELAIALERLAFVNKHREELLKAWVAQTGVPPQNAVLKEHNHQDGSILVSVHPHPILAWIDEEIAKLKAPAHYDRDPEMHPTRLDERLQTLEEVRRRLNAP